MINGIVLNHHSLPFSCSHDADAGMLAFLNILKVCRESGLKILLVDEGQDQSLRRIELARGYFLQDWLNKSNTDPELKDWCRFVKMIETRQPLFETADLTHIDGKLEVGLPGYAAGNPVLLAAFYFNTFLASFTAIADWTRFHINVWVFNLGDDPELTVSTLPNLCDSASLDEHGDVLNQRRNALLSTAKEIWQRRTEFFPHLTLLDNQIGTSLKNWSARNDILTKARDALNVLESFCNQWIAGRYAEYRHEYLIELGLAAEVSGESNSVYDTPKKKKEREFWLENGQKIYCENHVKLPDGYRLHFYPEPAEKRIYIAYLGPHLTL